MKRRAQSVAHRTDLSIADSSIGSRLAPPTSDSPTTIVACPSRTTAYPGVGRAVPAVPDATRGCAGVPQPWLTQALPASGIFDHHNGTTFYLDAGGSLLISYPLPDQDTTAVVELPAAALAALIVFLDRVRIAG